MKLILTIILFCHFLGIMAQDSIKLIKLNKVPIENITIIEEKAKNNDKKILREEFALDSFCQAIFEEYLFFCEETECKFEEASKEVKRLNIENENKGYYYIIDYDQYDTFNWEGCEKYSSLFVSSGHDCYYTEIRFIQMEKSRIILDGSSTGEIFYEEDIKRMPR